MLETIPNIENKLPIMEAFYTIQGEGIHQGKAAYFIRLAGCDVGCHWCDVKESWETAGHPLLSIKNILDEALQHESKLVVVTGGEPLMHDLTGLCYYLKQAGFKTHIETSGAHPLSGDWDWITLSPKKFKEAVADVIKVADELKVIVFNKSDFDFAQKYQNLVSKDCILLLQPEWSKEDEVLPMIISFVKSHPNWRISLQTHKYMNIP